MQNANTSISLQIYELSDPAILSLLKKKHREGVDVKIFHDKKRTLPKELPAYPVKTRGLMHRKILVIDEALVLLGTANFTTQSLKMHDNLILGLWHPELATKLEGNFAVGSMRIGCYLLPNVEAIKALEKCLEDARQSIQVAMFTLTHPSLVGKLAEAQKRGVTVSVAIDRYTAMGASRKAVEQLQAAGAEILLNRGSQLLHHKWALIDSKTLVLGSANWTAAAFAKNQDCLLILENLPSSERKVIKKIWNAVAIASEKL